MKVKCLFMSFLLVCLTGCVSSGTQLSGAPKPGFSNVTDIPIPKSAQIDQDKSMVIGSNEQWTGHLAYTTKESVPQVVDFINTEMGSFGWKKVSVLRGHETSFTYIRRDRVASIKIFAKSDVFSKSTVVTIDMAPAVVDAKDCQSPDCAAHS